MAQAKAQKAVAAASNEGTLKQQIVELTPASAAAVRKLLQASYCCCCCVGAQIDRCIKSIAYPTMGSLDSQ